MVKKQKISLRVTNSMGELLLFSSYGPCKYYSSNIRETLEKLIPFLIFLRTSYNNMSWSFPSMRKSRSWMDAFSNRLESMWFLFRGCIPHGSRDIHVWSFDHVTSSNLKWWAYSQIWAFLAALMYTLPWTFADT